MYAKLLALVLVGLFFSGCAVGRGQIDITVDEGANPESSVVVKITDVADNRVFEVSPPKANIPSLMEDEQNDRSIEVRAIARKRNTYGMALGDIILPEGRTVSLVVKEALTRALRESGVRVVSEGDPEFDDALPLQADIEKFWSWFRPGFWSIAMENESRIVLKGDWPVEEADRAIESEARLEAQIAATRQWRELFSMAIDNLVAKVKAVLRLETG